MRSPSDFPDLPSRSSLLLIDLGRGRNRLGGSILAQVLSQTGDVPPDVDSADDLKGFWNAIQQLGRERRILAYHDRSDGGLLATVVEMAFAGHVGVTLDLSDISAAHAQSAGDKAPGAEIGNHEQGGIGQEARGGNGWQHARRSSETPMSPVPSAFQILFSEELGAVIQVRTEDLEHVLAVLAANGLDGCIHRIGTLNHDHRFRVIQDGTVLLEEDLSALRAVWSDVTRRIASLRDNPACAEEEFKLKLEVEDPGITPKITFDYPGIATDGIVASTGPGEQALSIRRPRAPAGSVSVASVAGVRPIRPPIAILREQGVNGQVEMAAAFTRAGFRAVDVHMTDILEGRVSLRDFRGLVACGGFSYGDVLGAGEGWAKSVLFHERARAEFEAFFRRPDTFSLGVCNGCQMMSNLHSIIPGADQWPHFVQNRSERFEARFVCVRIEPSPSIFFAGMAGSVLPIAVAHGEGYAEFASAEAAARCSASGLVAARFVDHRHQPTEIYPLNPNGSPFGITSLTTSDGRATIIMPHPERVHRTVQMSWHPDTWGEDSPWMRMFDNARAWVG